MSCKPCSEHDFRIKFVKLQKECVWTQESKLERKLFATLLFGYEIENGYVVSLDQSHYGETTVQVSFEAAVNIVDLINIVYVHISGRKAVSRRAQQTLQGYRNPSRRSRSAIQQY